MSTFRKLHADAVLAAEILRRSDALRAAGVPTPRALPGDRPEELAFQHIDGNTGFPLLRLPMEQLLAPLALLHRTDVSVLPPLDPLRRITPRIGSLNRPDFAALTPAPPGDAVVHGDFHVGQLLLDERGKMWIVDLDDMARGHPASDLANFIAHLATSDAIGGDFRARLNECALEVAHAWTALGREFDPAAFDAHLRIALVRRHLKLREAGRPDFEAEIAAYLSAGTARISPSGTAAYPG